MPSPWRAANCWKSRCRSSVRTDIWPLRPESAAVFCPISALRSCWNCRHRCRWLRG